MVTFNSEHVVSASLGAIAGSDHLEIIVVDNCSTDGTVELIERDFPDVRVVLNRSNAGFAKAVNLGSSSASAKHLLLLNPDAVITAESVLALSSALDRRADAAIIAPLVADPDGEFATIGAGHAPTIWRMFTHASGLSRLSKRVPILEGHYLFPFNLRSTTSDVDWVSGGCLLTRRDDWKSLQGLTERWFMYAEDVDYCLRSRAAGRAVILYSDVHALHAVGGSSSSVDGRFSVAWIRNLYDLYGRLPKTNAPKRLLWRTVVRTGFEGRRAIYAGRYKLRRREADLVNMRRFRAYSRALATTKPTDNSAQMDRRSKVARYYDMARLAHIERLPDMVPGDFFFTRHRLDWNEGLTASAPNVRRVSLVGLLTRLWRSDYSAVEVPEPLALPIVPKLIAIACVVSAKNVLKGSKTSLVWYAIENIDVAEKLSAKTHLPRALSRFLLKLALMPVLRSTSRAVFGTEGARENYEALLGPIRATHRTLLALPQASAELGQKSEQKICFLGAFEQRKGILKLLEAWPLIRDAHPDASLTVMGHGPLSETVAATCAELSGVTLVLDPSREVISHTLSEAKVLVLLSERTPTWREQVGLPIVEALSYGCEIVSTPETGLAGWLRANGHTVTVDHPSLEQVAAAIGAAAAREPRSKAIKNSLPAVDSRIEADSWLFGGNAGG